MESADRIDIRDAVARSAAKARAAADSLIAATDSDLNAVLHDMAARLMAAESALLTANRRDVEAAEASGMGVGLLDRLRLDSARVTAMAHQLKLLAEVPFPPTTTFVRELPDGYRVEERRRPIGVVGVNYEARPGVTIDVAAQLIKSRNGGVLRTGSAALDSAQALASHVIKPAIEAAGLDSGAIEVLDLPTREAAHALVSLPDLIPVVIVRGSGDSTRELARTAAANRVRVLAHADGGGVLFVDDSAPLPLVSRLVREGLDRLGVCNRLNLLLVCESSWDRVVQPVVELLAELGITASLPPHEHPLGLEWALVEGRETTVTIAPVPDELAAAEVANRETSGLAATIAAEDAAVAESFMAAYRGTGVLWNATTRLIDGYKLLGVAETGISVDHGPGPRGPVTFKDLYLRQYAVTPPRP